MSKQTPPRFGGSTPMYKFMINPYPDIRVWKCPVCDAKMGQRTLPLVIHVDPQYLIALNYANRYCKQCDLLVAHKDQIEEHLTNLFSRNAPAAIGNDYLILGTLEKKIWRESTKNPLMPREAIPHVHDFAEHFRELRVTRAGWFPEGVEPPIAEPPASELWIKA